MCASCLSSQVKGPWPAAVSRALCASLPERSKGKTNVRSEKVTNTLAWQEGKPWGSGNGSHRWHWLHDPEDAAVGWRPQVLGK